MDKSTDESFEITKQNAELVKPVVAPLLFYENINDPRKWLSGGTAFFIKTKDNRFLVTAEHVIAKRDELMISKNVISFTGGDRHLMEDISQWQVISRNDEIDICTIQVPDSFDLSRIGKKFCEPRSWPIQKAKIGEKAFILGYPSQHRRAGLNEVTGSMIPIADFVTYVGPCKFIVADENNERITKIYTEEITDLKHCGGMSGSPIFVHRDDGWLEPAGVFIEGGGLIDGIRSPIFGAHLDFIDTTGVIKVDLIPPRL
jgi:hypothetical protein